jgi:hypothetical protein
VYIKVTSPGREVKADCTDFIIIRERYVTNGLDPYFHQNIQNAQKVDLKIKFDKIKIVL